MSISPELTDKINQYNTILTNWIQMRQGTLNLRIVSFPLQPLFDIVAKGKMSFQMKKIKLDVQPTTAKVKADRTLTLFMISHHQPTMHASLLLLEVRLLFLQRNMINT